ncbi:MAG: putative peptidase M15 [Prokaryotic dsDNA virus sp.]|nr:MAG: putative peptidase M15 [Prokaryotic dsDNA virus sp.]|tara:strand:- start:33846 stop:34232 length:387 start_codon:yes stop_codon:yes gene_type:complete
MHITKNFTTNEMMCHCGCGKSEMDNDFMKMLQAIRDEMQRPLKISSGFRCEYHNNKISSTGKNGPHTKAKAVDILISGADAMRLFAIAQKYGVSGIGMNQRGEHSKRFVHIDSLSPSEGPRPTVWTYG